MLRKHSRIVLALLITVALTAGSTVASSTEATATDWQRTVFESIRQAEYEFSSRHSGLWHAPNRAQHLRSVISLNGLRLVSRVETEQPWELSLSLAGVGRGDALNPTKADRIRTTTRANRIEIVHGPIREWFVNEPRGLEHGFTLSRAPGDSRREMPLVLEMEVAGGLVPVLSPSGSAVQFSASSGVAALNYDKLVVSDVTGTELAARFELQADRLRIVVDDRDAIYPVVIDPLVTTPDWALEANQAFARLGIAVAAAGNVNGDAYDDVAVGADKFDVGVGAWGKVFVYPGTATGIGTTPIWTATSEQEASRFGNSIAAADVNGDTFSDIIVGARGYEDIPAHDGEGWIFVYYGSAGGLGLDGTPANADWTAQADQAAAEFGDEVASAGFVNDDIYEDIIVGAKEYTKGQTDEGIAVVYHGSATGLDPGDRSSGTPTNADWLVEGDRVEVDFGGAVASAGDVNQDTYDDVLVGSQQYRENFSDEGRVYLYLGGPSGLSPTAVWVLTGERDRAQLGASVAGAGDVNDDGFDDVIVGAPGITSGQAAEGVAWVFHGLSSALLGSIPAWTGEANQSDAFYGGTVAGGGDINGDGFPDVLVSAEDFTDLELNEGTAFVYYGSANGLATTAARSFQIDTADAGFGSSIAFAGDVNADGRDDVIIGANTYTKVETEEGAVFAYLGCEDSDLDGICEADDNCPELANVDQFDTDADGTGDLCDPCQDVDVDDVCDAPFVLVESSGPGEEVLVQFGSIMRYLANFDLVNPNLGLDWTEFTFNDVSWTLAVYGIGYETTVGAADLIVTDLDPPGNCDDTEACPISVYTRADFVISDVGTVDNMFLGVDYDDGFTAWINGVEVFRSGEMPVGTLDYNTLPSVGHESSNGAVPNYGSLRDISIAGLDAIHPGVNTLAIGIWNTDSGSSDLLLVPRLSINRPRRATMAYRANESDPGFGSAWTQPFGFDEEDEGFVTGNYGVGFDTTGAADDLVNSEVDSTAVSVFTRAAFTIDLVDVEEMFLGADYDDGFAAWINGTEVYRSPGMAAGSSWNLDPPAHESSNGTEPDYGTLIDITTIAGTALVDGKNLLALGVWRDSTSGTDDLVVVPRLSINENGVDNCPADYNPGQENLDADELGDVCDPDVDGDGFANETDNCPWVSNNQDNADGDANGDACDICPGDALDDPDGDLICAGSGFSAPMEGEEDNCPVVANPPSDCDGMPGTPDEQCDLDGDGDGDLCDPDIDGDTFPNETDNCPFVDNDQTDTDTDTVGDACDCAAGNDQAWRAPEAVDSLRIARSDVCSDFTCTQSSGDCASDLDCVRDVCEDFACELSLGACDSNADCETDTCENFACRHGLNSCAGNNECTADVCGTFTCSESAIACVSDANCTTDVCANKTCVIGGNVCTAQIDCGEGDFCLGSCSIGTNNCVDDTDCVADFCQGLCSFGGNLCLDDSVCTDDVCEGACSIGTNVCTDDSVCIAPQEDLCRGECTLGTNTCADDSTCIVPQSDFCEGECSFGANTCTDDAVCVLPDEDRVVWRQPTAPGATSVSFDTVRSGSASDFVTSTTCLETGEADTRTTDATNPAASGDLLHYLVRVENACPAATVGRASDGTERAVVICP